MNRKKTKPLSMCILDGHTTQPGDLSWEPLQELGEVDIYDRTAPEDVLARAQGKAVVITNKVVLNREIIDQLPDCRLVCLLSTGTNVVDLEACRARGIPVCNVPAYSSDSVAEIVFGLLLAWARGVEQHAEAVRQEDWSGQPDFSFSLKPQRELRGLCLGLLGFGGIAQAVCRIAVGFGMNVWVCTPHPADKPDLGQVFVDWENLLSSADVLSLHCPLTPETRRIINSGSLSKLRKGAVLINTARGDLLDEAAVAAALQSGHLGAALLDVLSAEPPPRGHPLLQAPNTWITPHLAWGTREARARLIGTLAGNVRAFLEGSPVNVVNGV